MLQNQSDHHHQQQLTQRANFQQYHKINAYTHKISKEQIITFILFLIHLIMHFVFIIRPIFGIDHIILYFLWALYLVSMIAVGIDYFILTCGDPVDLLVANPDNKQDWKAKQMKFNRNNCKEDQNLSKNKNNLKNPYKVKQCKFCKRVVKIASYHCWTCKRCVEDMDHHCKYLNNCIGGRNYNSFFRLLSFVTVYFCLAISIGIWIFILCFSSQMIESLIFTKWMSLAYSLYSFVLLIVVQVLLWFHCYISCYLKMTTLQYVYRDTPSNNGVQSIESSASQTAIKSDK